jgi:hypothetical protein
MWLEFVGLIYLVLLLGAALMANVTDGPMREHRGLWYARIEIGLGSVRRQII